MPEFIQQALEKSALVHVYRSRPPYQQNDYISWISRARREETRAKRLEQMLDELQQGDRYMGMVYHSPEWKK
jgi:uncharacterized protein YdeI (YjbR/CyaY-like superfamily)